jgi:hypothetical protein
MTHEATEAQIALGAHILSEWLDDRAPLNERRYREPVKAAYEAMLALAQPLTDERDRSTGGKQ